MRDPSKPHYPVPWIASYFLTALLLIIGVIFGYRYLAGVTNGYDRADPDFAYLERIAGSATPQTGNFSKLNGGDWTVLCLIGSGADTAAALKAASVAAPLASRITAAVEQATQDKHETEFTLVYVKGSGELKLLRDPHGYAFARAGDAQCAMREAAVLKLPVGSGK